MSKLFPLVAIIEVKPPIKPVRFYIFGAKYLIILYNVGIVLTNKGSLERLSKFQ